MAAVAPEPQKLTIRQFLAFYETRPDEERWQLVDGVALLMTPPFPTHQLIASNLERLLNDVLERHAPHLVAIQRIGIELLQFPHYRPEPDVAVVDAEIAPKQRHFDRSYLVAEVISDSDDERIDLKREFYQAHSPNRAILLIRQDRQELELDRRVEGVWRTETLRGPEAILQLPDFGLACEINALYRRTYLAA